MTLYFTHGCTLVKNKKNWRQSTGDLWVNWHGMTQIRHNKYFAIPLVDVFSESFTSGLFPKIWKTYKVCGVQKTTPCSSVKYLSRHNAALKILFFELLRDLKLADEVPPWYSPVKQKPVYENSEVQVFWDVPVYADYQEVRANRVDARIINHKSKRKP